MTKTYKEGLLEAAEIARRHVRHQLTALNAREIMLRIPELIRSDEAELIFGEIQAAANNHEKTNLPRYENRRDYEGGFTDANGKKVRSGDRVLYQYGPPGKHWIIGDILQDGDCVLTDPNDETEMVQAKWVRCCLVP